MPFRQNSYVEVYVLLFYWEDTRSSGFKEKRDVLEKLFYTDFNYTQDYVTRIEIPLHQSDFALEQRIFVFILRKGKDSLLIIHYGGHDDADEDIGE